MLRAAATDGDIEGRCSKKDESTIISTQTRRFLTLIASHCPPFKPESAYEKRDRTTERTFSRQEVC